MRDTERMPIAGDHAVPCAGYYNASARNNHDAVPRVYDNDNGGPVVHDNNMRSMELLRRMRMAW